MSTERQTNIQTNTNICTYIYKNFSEKISVIQASTHSQPFDWLWASVWFKFRILNKLPRKIMHIFLKPLLMKAGLKSIETIHNPICLPPHKEFENFGFVSPMLCMWCAFIYDVVDGNKIVTKTVYTLGYLSVHGKASSQLLLTVNGGYGCKCKCLQIIN